MTTTHISFQCPGCGLQHTFPTQYSGERPNWTLTGEASNPTLAEPFLARTGDTHTGDPFVSCDNCPRAEPELRCGVCAGFVGRGGAGPGQIKFLPNSTHALAGQVVDIPEGEGGP